jgi:endonuclease YncB( thermonuclease family)
LTIDLQVDLGFYVQYNARIRVAGVDAPEMRTPEGQAATLWAMTLLGGMPYVTVRTELDRTFDRFVGRIELPDGTDYAERLIDAGHGTRRTA